MSRQAAALELDGLNVAYGEHLILRDITFEVGQGEFVTVVGPSGCGKTTLLLALAGLLPPLHGEIRVGGEPIDGPGEDRAMVFQDFALLPWKTVLANVTLGLDYRHHGRSPSERAEIARRYIRLAGLAGWEGHFPSQLSGGMKQRVGLARAFAVDAPILLMDEPFQAVDAQNAEVMREELLHLVGIGTRTVVFVTHDLDEALYLSDRILLMGANPGVVVEDVTVDLPRPRRMDVASPAQRDRYMTHRGHLWDHLRTEVEAYRALRQGDR